MGYAKLKTKISVEDYLQGEETSPVRYEYLYGEVWAMAGTSKNHNRIAGNLFNLLSSHLSDGDCEAFIENIKVRVSEDVFYYPDVIVTCEGESRNEYFSEGPKLIIEVISPSTEKIDRREKLVAYQKMPSVHEIVLVDQQKIAIEVHRRQPDGRWITYYFDRSDPEFFLEAADITIFLDDVYRRVTFDGSDPAA